MAVGIVMLALATTLFTTLSAELAIDLHWVAHIQIFPLALAGSIAGILAWLALTLVFGRIYCSTVCPMGILQDVFARMPRLGRRRRFRNGYRYEEPRNKFRYTWLTVVVGCSVAGIALAATLFDPYSAFGRICSEILLPVWEWVCGAPVLVASWLAFGIAAATLVAVAAVAWRSGRLVCNTICPVGSTLSLVSRYALMHFDIDTDVCVNCGQCGRVCKSKCINMADHVVDASRCVVCFDCVDTCHEGAIRYTYRRKRLSVPMMQPVTPASTAMSRPSSPASPAPKAAVKSEKPQAESGVALLDRRQFLATGLVIAATPAIAAASRQRKRIEAIAAKRRPLEGLKPVVPPGRRSLGNFLQKCTGCGLCVAHCPAKVLRPSAGQLGIANMLHPGLDLDASYCRYNCTRCTDVCPTGALTPLSTEEKHIFVIGKARVEPANCIGCGLCVRRCPREAISMKARKADQPGPSVLIASVDSDECIGCGACQYICPATPVKAIGVSGTDFRQ